MLRRRAGFAATWDELERDLTDGPDAAIERVLAGTCRMDGLVDGFASTADLLGTAAASSSDAHRLQAWWLYRMLFTPDPLTERLTLLWHNHFATSQLKVGDVAAMHDQNETFRRHACAPFGDLLRAMLRDPALLIWLDAPSNRKGAPNENLARELLELFTLGAGHYTEKDVKEAARALTGLTVNPGRFELRTDRHDAGPKTILHESGPFDSDKLVDVILSQPATAVRLAWRLSQALLGENIAGDRAIAELAQRLRADGLHVGRAVETVVRSQVFFSQRNVRAQVIDPAGFVIGTARALERFEPPPSTLLLAEWTKRMGQDLFFPPNVGGWPGGRSWLSGRSVVARSNFSAAVAEGRLNARSTSTLSSETQTPDLRGLARRRGHNKTNEETLDFFAELLLGRPLHAPERTALARGARAAGGSESEQFNRTVALLLSRPEAHLT